MPRAGVWADKLQAGGFTFDAQGARDFGWPKRGAERTGHGDQRQVVSIMIDCCLYRKTAAGAGIENHFYVGIATSSCCIHFRRSEPQGAGVDDVRAAGGQSRPRAHGEGHSAGTWMGEFGIRGPVEILRGLDAGPVFGGLILPIRGPQSSRPCPQGHVVHPSSSSDGPWARRWRLKAQDCEL